MLQLGNVAYGQDDATETVLVKNREQLTLIAAVLRYVLAKHPRRTNLDRDWMEITGYVKLYDVDVLHVVRAV